MDPGTKTALLLIGLVFVGIFLAMTIAVALEEGFDVFTVFGLFVVLMLGAPLIGSLFKPPKD